MSEHTVSFYAKELKQTLRAFSEINAPITDIQKMSKKDVENFIINQQEYGRAVNTINARLRAGHTFFNFCLSKKYVKENPYANVQQLKKRYHVGATYSKLQLKKLLDAPDIKTFVGLRDLAIMCTFAFCGIRLNELISLRIQDVSFEGVGAINVQWAKNRYARRIPLTKRLKKVLQAYLVERGVLDTDALFISADNTPINPRSIQNRLKFYGEKTGVIKEIPVNPHAFRRTFCRLKVEAGTNIFVLQRLIGHQSLEVLKRYVEIYGRDLEEAIEIGFEEI